MKWIVRCCMKSNTANYQHMNELHNPANPSRHPHLMLSSPVSSNSPRKCSIDSGKNRSSGALDA